MRLRSWMLLAVALSWASTARAQQRADPWWGRDKALHFGISGALGAGGYGLGSLVFERRWARAATGTTIALGAGVAKELYDAAGYGDPSGKDLLFDVAGTVVGVTCAWLVDLAFGGDSTESEAQLATGLALSF